MSLQPQRSTLFPYTTLFRSLIAKLESIGTLTQEERAAVAALPIRVKQVAENTEDRKSTRLNSSHVRISYAVFCLKKKTQKTIQNQNQLQIRHQNAHDYQSVH